MITQSMPLRNLAGTTTSRLQSQYFAGESDGVRPAFFFLECSLLRTEGQREHVISPWA